MNHWTRGDLWHKEVNQWGKGVELSEHVQIQGLAGSHEDITQQGGQVKPPESGQILGSAICFLNAHSLIRPSDIDKIEVEGVGGKWAFHLLIDGLLQIGHHLGLIDLDWKDAVISHEEAPNDQQQH